MSPIVFRAALHVGLLAVLLSAGPVVAPLHAAPRAFVVESDFATGSFSGIDVATRALACNVASVHSDARVRWYGGQVFVVNRFGADNIQVMDGGSYAFVRQFSVGNGANPYDIAFASATRAYVTRYESADLWVVNPATGAHTGTISLAGLADADGIPEMDRLLMVGPLLFVSLQRVNRNAGFQPTDSSLVAVIDTRTDTLVDCDAATAGVQGILLPRTNPVTPFVLDVPRSRLYLGCAGRYGQPDGGIVSLDAAALTASAVVASEDSLGGDVLDLAWHDDARAYAIVSDAGFNTSLVRWSPVTGRREATLYSPGGFTLADAEVTPDGSEVWACNSSFGSPGVRVFSTGTGLLVAPPLVCTLPPQGIAFDRAENLEAGLNMPGAAVALSPPFPNPARGAVRLAFTLPVAAAGALDVLDVAGRRVRQLRIPGAVSPLNTLVWDLTDDAGRSLAPGLYLVRLRAGTARASRTVMVIR